MALKIVTGGTTGAANGTLVSSGNPLVITALNTAIDAHIRCDDGYWSNDQSFDVPAELQVSFDGGSTYYGNADEPITAPEIYAVNVPIKVKQTTAAASTSGSFVTDGTYTAIAALSTPTLTATVISGTQIDLSWTNVANEDASPGYTIERSLNGSTWSALTTKAANVTTHSDTGLTGGTHYYYRVKAEGSGRYSDSGWGTDDDTTATTPFTDAFTGSAGTVLSSHTPTGASTPFTRTNGSPNELRIASNRLGIYKSSTGAASARYKCAAADEPSSANCFVEVDVYCQTTDAGYVLITLRDQGYGSPGYFAFLEHNGDLSMGLGGVGVLDSDTTTLGTMTAGQTRRLRLEANGTTIKAFVDDVELCSATDSGATAADAVSIEVQCAQANNVAGNGLAADNLEWGNL